MILLLCSSRLFAGSFEEVKPSSSEEILSLTTDLLIDGFVSVTSGQIAISEIDLIVKGAQDLVLKRSYVAPWICGRYDKKDKLDCFILAQEITSLKNKGWVVHPHLWIGYNVHSKFFQVRDPQGFVLQFEIQGNKGILKTASYGFSNLRGDCPSSSADIRNIELLIDGSWAIVTWPDGVVRYYLKQSPGRYRLEKEILVNGKMIRYEYESKALCKISSSDPTGELTYAYIKKGKDDHYVGSDQREVRFTYEEKEIKGRYKKKGSTEKIRTSFSLMSKGCNPTYTHTAAYNDRTLLNAYDAKSYPISCTYIEDKDVVARVKTLTNPSGSFSFFYDPAVAGEKGGLTRVTHPDGVETVYRFNKLLLIEAIENWLDGTLVNQKTFEYDHKQHIARIATLDGNNNLLIAKSFVCDDAGNPTLETAEGDFGVFHIKRTFDKNRLVFEEYDSGLAYAFTYLEGTRLVTSKTTFDAGKKIRKTIYSYDSACNLIEKEEEGKKRTVYTLYQTAPHLHRIEWEETTDWQGQLLGKIHYAYDRWGNVNRQDHFGSDGTLSYTIERTYNEKGELLAETNPLNETAIYQYDARGRCVYQEPISNGLTISRSFDEKGRLILLQRQDQQTHFEYNQSDELTKKVDYLGFITKYHYDKVHGKPDRIEEESSITKTTYDPFGRAILIIDPLLGQTSKKYNSYGDVVEIIHPEGEIEAFTYYPRGLLKSHTDAGGLTTLYTYDALGRITDKTTGTVTSTFEYDGYNLLTTIDPAGYVTTYEYDARDKKIEERREGRTTRYGYDSLGFLNREEKGGYITEYTNDPLGRVLSQSADDLLHTFWTYDKGGNVVAIERGGITALSYDCHNRCVEKIDEEGNKTVISYKSAPRLLIKTTTDPEGIETVDTYNVKDQLVSKRIAGQIVAEYEYDPMFRLQRQDHIRFNYTPSGNKASMEEAGMRKTLWTYNPLGLILSKQKPDGTLIPYEYNQQQLLTRMGSREFRYDLLGRLIGGTGFSRTLDPFGNIVREEWTTGLWVETDYDELDRPVMRRLPDQTSIKYDYHGPFLSEVSRFSSRGRKLYSHSYQDYDARGNPCLENCFFQTRYEYDKAGRRIYQENPYLKEEIEYSPSGKVIRKGDRTYTYDSLSQMISESDQFTASYDVHYNLTQLNHEPIQVDSLNQIKGLSYDMNGNQCKEGFVYDEFNQLIQAGGQRFTYDALGRRIQKGNTAFLYLEDEEIGAFEEGMARQIKIPGKNAPITIEIKQIPYAPVIDVQGVIRSLVDVRTQKIVKQNDCDAFGMGLSDDIPYAYTGKRYDLNTGLVYFGKRYYDPIFRRWLTTDPIGPENHSNLYQYLFNSPYLYEDPSGEFAFAIPLLIWGAELMLPTLSACITAATYTAAASVIAYAGYKGIEAINKNTDVYAPDRPLPLTENGVPIADTDAPHTQLGTKSSKRRPGEKYPQAREFGANGKPVKTIDFTDHGEPGIHSNPHEHRCKPNPTGGTPERGNPEKLQHWQY
jgi:RHS repeat-associated protein